MDNILKERRFRWLGHVFRMDHQRIPQQALYWQVPGHKRGPSRPRANWRGVISKDLRKMGFTWEEAEVAALDRHGWRRECGPMCPVGYGMNQGQGSRSQQIWISVPHSLLCTSRICCSSVFVYECLFWLSESLQR